MIESLRCRVQTISQCLMENNRKSWRQFKQTYLPVLWQSIQHNILKFYKTTHTLFTKPAKMLLVKTKKCLVYTMHELKFYWQIVASVISYKCISFWMNFFHVLKSSFQGNSNGFDADKCKFSNRQSQFLWLDYHCT